jgi:hypothetical protein
VQLGRYLYTTGLEWPYVAEREKSTWRKILNPNYSQRVGREELFERERRISGLLMVLRAHAMAACLSASACF